MVRQLGSAAAVAAAVCACAFPAHGQIRWRITDLGTVPSFRGNIGREVNEAGQVTGEAVTAAFRTRAFLWDSGAFLDLGVLEPGDENDSVGNDINIHGHVCGWSYVGDREDQHAFYYDGTNLLDLGTLGADTDSIARGINDSNQVVGFSNPGNDAFRWSPGTGMQDLGFDGIPEAINNAGVIAGHRALLFDTRAFRYSGGVITDLPSLPGASDAQAFGINELGQIVGSSEQSGFSNWQRGAVRWEANNAIVPLAKLPDEQFGPFRITWEGGIALDINRAGVAVGEAHDYTDLNDLFPVPVAVVWFGDNVYKLQDLVLNIGGWSLDSAVGINDQGQIVGTGIIGGQRHAFLLNPVYPDGAIIVPNSTQDVAYVFDPQQGLPFASFGLGFVASPVEIIDGHGSDLLVSDASSGHVMALTPAGAFDEQYTNTPAAGLAGIARSLGGYIVGAASGGFAAWQSNGAGGLQPEVTDDLNDVLFGQIRSNFYLVSNDADNRAEGYDLQLNLLGGTTPGGMTSPRQLSLITGARYVVCDFIAGRVRRFRLINSSAAGSFAVNGSPAGVIQFDNGNLLVATTTGVHQYTVGGSYVRTVLSGAGFQYLSRCYNYRPFGN